MDAFEITVAVLKYLALLIMYFILEVLFVAISVLCGRIWWDFSPDTVAFLFWPAVVIHLIIQFSLKRQVRAMHFIAAVTAIILWILLFLYLDSLERSSFMEWHLFREMAEPFVWEMILFAGITLFVETIRALGGHSKRRNDAA